MKFKFAFSLSEVLITLTVIGIIAAITIPMLWTNYKQEETCTKLKKAYSNLSNVIRLAESDYGSVSNWDFPSTYQGYEFSPFYLMYIKPYLNTVKSYQSRNSDYYKTINNIDGNPANQVTHWDYLADGTSIATFSAGTNYFWIFIDLNGEKNPNRLGKDIFMFDLKYKMALTFWGDYNWSKLQNSDNYTCKKGTNQQYAGGYCGALIAKSGWKITEKYPW
ncbi:MAG: type II secretion system protein [Candidatus Gastranaerophilales bacterium]|nr:type II secretion system protein [Candidatus Gastranaerophilales bacterium]